MKIRGVLLLILLSGTASAGVFKGNWDERFNFPNTHYIRHTPMHIWVDGYITENLDISGPRLFFGMEIGRCGLHLNIDMTREEFITALTCAGLVPL